MSTRAETVETILEQAASAGDVSARKMFGEYALYCGEKLVGLICKDELFIKPTPAGRASLGGSEVEERPPYPGAKPSLVIPGERWEDGEWLATLVRRTAADLPAPKKPRTGR